ncbi:glutathione S-transferase theta-3-like [Mizuhopecten yessoensis]|uniref:glutathione S-transferase theta-3-like n=1 Tax=Mizuhopecten yessoensis TaxID=6573 RepID=UPI000B45D088|nr:glutathione S-transferase theta-3-like [Mizuhopecten yessoensis]
MALTLYYDLMSQPSRAVYIFLQINNISFTAKPVALRNDEHYTDWFKKINPWCVVPVIDDDGFILTESVAILKYLAVKHNVPDHWYPQTDLKAQARIDEYMSYQHLNTRYDCTILFRELVRLPTMNKAPIQWHLVENERNQVRGTVSHLASYFLKDDKPFLCGSDISIADLLCVCELMQLITCCEEKLYESNPVIKTWVDRVRANIDSVLEEAHQIVYRVRSKFSMQNKL